MLRVPIMPCGWVVALVARTGLYRLGLLASCISGIKGTWVGSACPGSQAKQARVREEERRTKQVGDYQRAQVQVLAGFWVVDNPDQQTKTGRQTGRMKEAE